MVESPAMLIALTAYDDVYVPEIAGDLIAGLHGLSEEDGAVTIVLMAYEAEAELMRN